MESWPDCYAAKARSGSIENWGPKGSSAGPAWRLAEGPPKEATAKLICPPDAPGDKDCKPKGPFGRIPEGAAQWNENSWKNSKTCATGF